MRQNAIARDDAAVVQVAPKRWSRRLRGKRMSGPVRIEEGPGATSRNTCCSAKSRRAFGARRRRGGRDVRGSPGITATEPSRSDSKTPPAHPWRYNVERPGGSPDRYSARHRWYGCVARCAETKVRPRASREKATRAVARTIPAPAARGAPVEARLRLSGAAAPAHRNTA